MEGHALCLTVTCPHALVQFCLAFMWCWNMSSFWVRCPVVFYSYRVSVKSMRCLVAVKCMFRILFLVCLEVKGLIQIFNKNILFLKPWLCTRSWHCFVILDRYHCVLKGAIANVNLVMTLSHMVLAHFSSEHLGVHGWCSWPV